MFKKRCSDCLKSDNCLKSSENCLKNGLGNV